MGNKRHDLIIIGGGPSGLAAAINASSEGLHTILIDSHELGGQAVASTLVENYPGFSEDISGAALMSKFIKRRRGHRCHAQDLLAQRHR